VCNICSCLAALKHLKFVYVALTLSKFGHPWYITTSQMWFDSIKIAQVVTKYIYIEDYKTVAIEIA
jgi:hypothetical protein